MTRSEGPTANLDTHIVGLGSPFGSDDEIGLELVRILSGERKYAGRCRLLESADAAMIASSLLEWRCPAILVDAADMELTPGESRFFTDSDASLFLKTSSVSSHGLGIAEGLALARTLGYDQPVGIFGVQPFDLSPKQGLTPQMMERFPSLLAELKSACRRPLRR